jgi:hypothetical protein
MQMMIGGDVAKGVLHRQLQSAAIESCVHTTSNKYTLLK